MARGKLGNDGLTDRQREFVRIVRSNPWDGAITWADLAARAGYKGSRRKLHTRAWSLMRHPAVTAALYGGSEGTYLRAVCTSPRSTPRQRARAEHKLLL